MYDIKQNGPKRNGRYVQGQFEPGQLSKCRSAQPVIYRSSWELDFIKSLERNPHIIQWSSESVRIPYAQADGSQHTYFPDFALLLDTGQIIIAEIKPYSQAVLRENMSGYDAHQNSINVRKWASAKEFCEQRGWKFVVITERFLNRFIRH